MKKIIFIAVLLIYSFANAFGQESDCTSGDRLKSTILFYSSEGEQSVDSVFTVADGTKVIFRGGNLLYQPKTGIYKIADEQYDYVGGQGVASVDDNVTNPTTELYNQGTLYYVDDKGVRQRCTNSLSSGYQGWIDLHKFYVLDSADHADSFIIGGKEYRTLTEAEYTYLFFTRPNAKSLRGRARIKLGNRGGSRNDSIINGFILLPDNWNPSILPNKQFIADITPSNGNTYYTDNVFTREEWKILEKQGAIFLPAGGSVDKGGNTAKKCNRSGFYWLTTAPDGSHAITLEFGGYYYKDAAHPDGRPGDPSYVRNKNKEERRLIRLVEVVTE